MYVTSTSQKDKGKKKRIERREGSGRGEDKGQ